MIKLLKLIFAAITQAVEAYNNQKLIKAGENKAKLEGVQDAHKKHKRAIDVRNADGVRTEADPDNIDRTI